MKESQTAKEAILTHTKLRFPDYSLRWVLRTDASQRGVGSVLLQTKINDQGEEIVRVRQQT